VNGFTPLVPHLQDCVASLACARAELTCNFAPRYVILRLSLHLSLARTCTAIDGAPPPHLSLAMAADAAQALNARAVSLGAPPALPSYCSSDWVLFKEAKAPVFIIDGGVHIPKLESAKITYAGYFDPVADTSSALIKMRLRCK
jgi:hypothetical protein